jgi:hypothetical protein
MLPHTLAEEVCNILRHLSPCNLKVHGNAHLVFDTFDVCYKIFWCAEGFLFLLRIYES